MNVKIIQNVLENTLDNFPRGHWSFLGPGSEKEAVRNLRLQTRWILGPNCRKNAAELQKIWSSDIPWYHCPGERTIKQQRGRKDNYTFHSK